MKKENVFAFPKLLLPRLINELNKPSLTDFSKIDKQHCFELIWRFGTWLERDIAEMPQCEYVHVIPYVKVISIPDGDSHDKFFIAYERGKESERRLDGKISIGWGGHVEESDYHLGLNLIELINDSANRELKEEIPDIHVGPIHWTGFIMDPTTEVGRQHFGIHGITFAGAVEKTDNYFPLNPLNPKVDLERLEVWSKLIF